jgi:hypothetical protein
LKKFLVLLSAIALAIGLTACSNNNEAKTDKQESKEEATAPKVDIKKELVKFYMDLGNKINAKDADLNAYIAKATKEDAKPEELPTAEDKAKASEAAAAVAAELNDKKADLESAIKDYAASYQTKADELKKDVPNLDAASASLTKAEEKLGKVFESEDLLAPSLDKQVN